MAILTTFRSDSGRRSSDHPPNPTKLVQSSKRSSSAHPCRRVAKLNMYLSRSSENASDRLHQTYEPMPNAPSDSSCIKRWDGYNRETTYWDSVRKDPELWFPHGDCLVHFYERGISRRGASLRLPLADIRQRNCQPLLDTYHAEFVSASPSSSTESDSSTDTSNFFSDSSSPVIKSELHIPAPTHLSREQALRYHLTTRNFFALIFQKPIVGESLGSSLIALVDRMNLYKSVPSQTVDEILAYIDQQGYTDFRECPEHALAILQLSERLRDRELWTDAFVHCTGMYERLDASGEFDGLSRSSQALVTRAHVEMESRLEQAGRSLQNFLENDLSGTSLGLSKEAQLHLQRFRSFLHTYHVAQHGYWPPPPPKDPSESFSQLVYHSMYLDFRNLYEYLVDRESGVSIQNNKPVDGGICVFQNVMAFDKINKYPSLPHSLPLVPRVPLALDQRNPFGKIFGSRTSKLERRINATTSLVEATNGYDGQLMDNGLVREYARFERSWTLTEEGTISCADARKVRWILVYTILQTLISVNRIPKEVRDTKGVMYPLCCQIAGTPPWPHCGTNRASAPGKVPSRTTSLIEQIMETGPDMDMVSTRPSPVDLDGRRHTASPPCKVSLTKKLSLRTPLPIRAKPIEILAQGYVDGSLLESNTPEIPPQTDILSNERPKAPIRSHSGASVEQCVESDSPTTSVAGGSSGWSANTSEDGMDHTSVHGSEASNYDDDDNSDDDLRPSAAAKARSLYPACEDTLGKEDSQSGFRAMVSNPEVDQYVLS